MPDTTCQTCGSKVADGNKHNEWHRKGDESHEEVRRDIAALNDHIRSVLNNISRYDQDTRTVIN